MVNYISKLHNSSRKAGCIIFRCLSRHLQGNCRNQIEIDYRVTIWFIVINLVVGNHSIGTGNIVNNDALVKSQAAILIS